MIGAVGLLRLVLTLQIALAAGALGWAAIRLEPARRVRLGRALLVLCLLAPLIVPSLPVDPPYRPPAQVWAGASWREREPVASLELGERPVAVVRAAPPVSAGVAVVAALSLAGAAGALWSLVGLRRLLGPAVRWRRIRGVDILVSPRATTPCTLRLARPVIVLDVDTFSDPERRLMALRHELQHQRAGDAAFAWLLSLVGLLSFANPLATLWRRRLVEAEEMACDAAILARGVRARPYAEALLQGALRARPLAFPGLVSPRKSTLQRRITMLLNPAPRRSPLLGRLAALLAFPLVLSAAWAGDHVVADHRVSMDEVRRVADRIAPQTTLPVVANPQVQDALERMIATPGGLRFVRLGLDGYGAQGAHLEDELASAGLPRALSAVPFVESGYRDLSEADLSPSVPPSSRGAGYWMFIRTTARAYGLRVDDQVDERRDLDKETAAAIDLLDDLHARYGDWGLALAAYNQGPDHVDAAIRKGGTRDVWALQDQGLLNDYVAQVMAAALILAEPSLLE